MSRNAARWVVGLVPLTLLAIVLLTVKVLPVRGADEAPPSDCTAGPSKSVDPDTVLLGEEAQVTMNMTHTCASERLPVDLMFIVDVSSSMMRDPRPGGGLPTTAPGDPTRDPEMTPGTPEKPTTPPGLPTTRPPGVGDKPLDPCQFARGLPGGTDTPGGGLPTAGSLDPTATPRRRPRSTPTPTEKPTLTPEPGIGDRPQPEPYGDQDLVRDVQKSIRDFMDQTAIAEDLASGRLKSGLVSFSDNGRRVVGLTDRPESVRAGLNSLRGGGSSQLALGVTIAAREMRDTFYGGETTDRVKMMIIYSDGQFCDRDVNRSASDRNGVNVITVGVGRDYNRKNMTDLASQREYALELNDLKELTRIYTDLLPGTKLVTMDTLTVIDVLSPDMMYVPDSAVPPPTDVVTRMLKWVFTPATDPLTITYRVQPQAGGVLPVSDSADATWTDNRQHNGAVAFPPVDLNVLVPTATPEAPTATPTATATPLPEPRYIPYAVNKWPPPLPTMTPTCEPSERAVDLALVVDTSISMADPTQPGGVAKLDAAIAAAKGLVDILNFQPDGSLDHVAVISFNDQATLVSQLTGDKAQVQAALASLPTLQAPGTNIDHGLEAGYNELTSSRHRQSYNRALILVTDGRQATPGTENLVLAQADRIKAEGIELWTVGLGMDADIQLLQAAATSPDYFRHAPSTDDLQFIYEEIAHFIPCR